MLEVQIGDNMRKVATHSHYVSGVMSEDESGSPADNSMHPEFGAAIGGASVSTIGGRHAPAPAPRRSAPAPRPAVSADDE